MAQDVTLPQLVSEVAELHARFARDEVFVTGVHDSVDHNAVILTEVLARLEAVEGRVGTTEVVVTKVALDAEANDVKLDAQLRTELNAVTSRLGDELRAENSKVQKAFVRLEAVVATPPLL